MPTNIINKEWENQNKNLWYILILAIITGIGGTIFFFVFNLVDKSLLKLIYLPISPLIIFAPIFFWLKYDLYKTTPFALSFRNKGMVISQKLFNEQKYYLKYSEIDSAILRYETKKYFDEVVIKLKNPNRKKYGNFKKRGYGIIFQRIDKKIVNKLKENVNIIEE